MYTKTEINKYLITLIQMVMAICCWVGLMLAGCLIPFVAGGPGKTIYANYPYLGALIAALSLLVAGYIAYRWILESICVYKAYKHAVNWNAQS